MIVILSQKIDTESSYTDTPFKTYHYPARYQKQLHVGDSFIYYQGNRYDRTQRYYFGTGKISDISVYDSDSFLASLSDCQRFKTLVPIYHPNGGYIESLGYGTIRRSKNPPWQSSIRPLSVDAFNYIMKAAGICLPDKDSVPDLENQLKKYIRQYYLDKDNTAILDIEKTAAGLAALLQLKQNDPLSSEPEAMVNQQCSKLLRSDSELVQYCLSMKMSYSYKPILILALLENGNPDGSIDMNNAANYFRKYYDNRRKRGLLPEKKTCLYQRADASIAAIIENIITNPVNALCKSNLFGFNSLSQRFFVLPEIWKKIGEADKDNIRLICHRKLEMYYGENR